MSSISENSCRLIRKIICESNEELPYLKSFVQDNFLVTSRKKMIQVLSELSKFKHIEGVPFLIKDMEPLGHASIILAFPGIGKTTYCNSYPNTCLDLSEFSWIETPEQRNLNFPNNYLEAIKQNLSLGYEYIFIPSHAEVRRALYIYNWNQDFINKLQYKVIYPSIDRKAEFLNLYQARGSSESFVKLLEDNWDSWLLNLDLVNDNKKCLHSGFISDYLQ